MLLMRSSSVELVRLIVGTSSSAGVIRVRDRVYILGLLLLGREGILYEGVKWMSGTYTNKYMDSHGRGKDR